MLFLRSEEITKTDFGRKIMQINSQFFLKKNQLLPFSTIYTGQEISGVFEKLWLRFEEQHIFDLELLPI